MDEPHDKPTDERALEVRLRARFAAAREPVASSSLAPEIMARIAAAEDPHTALPEAERDHDWVIGFAALLGALVCLPAVQGLDVASLLDLVGPERLGAFADSFAALAGPLVLVLAVLPMLWLALED